MRKTPEAIEQITVRRAKVADTDKVRYRVYSTPSDFIAVIAESALMAVKVAGIAKPHKIVRDLPTEGIAIEAKKMEAIPRVSEKVAFPTSQLDRPSQLFTELAPLEKKSSHAGFKPMSIGEMQHSGERRARIIPPDLVNQIIEEHLNAPHPAPPVAKEQAPPPSPAIEAPPETPETPPLTQAEKLLQLADAALPQSDKLPNEKTLTPEEVAKLLHE